MDINEYLNEELEHNGVHDLTEQDIDALYEEIILGKK
jgi:hypothetical protein